MAISETTYGQVNAWLQSLPVRPFPWPQLRDLGLIQDERGITWAELINEVLARAKTDSAFLASAEKAAQAMYDANLTNVIALWPEEPLVCVLVGEILNADREGFLLSATSQEMDHMDRFCKERSIEWETFCDLLRKSYSLRQQG